MPGVVAGSEGVKGILRLNCASHSRIATFAQNDKMPLTFYKKPGLVVYVTCGDPDLATTRAVVLAAIEAGRM
jgi:hypothetical protein